MGSYDDAFVDVAVKQGRLDEAVASRLVAFARLKQRPVARVACDLGVLDADAVSRIARLARYRVARAEDKVYAEVAARSGALSRQEAADALIRQRETYGKGRGFVRLAALLRMEGRLSPDQDRRIRLRVKDFESSPKKECAHPACRAVLLASDPVCPTCGALALSQPSGSGANPVPRRRSA